MPLRARDLFRPARPSRPAWNLVKTFAQAALFWVIALYLVPFHLVFPVERELLWALSTPALLRASAWGLFAACAALNLWSGVALAAWGEGTPLPLDHPRRLVVRGPYRYVRNPMAVGGLGMGIALALQAGSPLYAAVVVATGLAWHFVARPPEEQQLLDDFGEDYARYRAEVPLWRPRLRRAR